MSERYAELTSLNLQWEPPTLESASEAECIVDGQRMIMLSANNYLNLTTHPRVVAAMVEATKLYGADDIIADKKVRNQFADLQEDYGTLPVCMAKTQYSLVAIVLTLSQSAMPSS